MWRRDQLRLGCVVSLLLACCCLATSSCGFNPGGGALTANLMADGLLSTSIFGVALDASNAYVAGLITAIHTASGDVSTQGVARWDGSAWHEYNPTATTISSPTAAAIYNGELYVGGSFKILDSTGAEIGARLARWDGSAWRAVGTGVSGGLNPVVNALVVHDGELVVGGKFTTAGGTPASNIARWNGTTWAALGTGLDGQVLALAEYAGKVVAAGSFSSFPFVAVWDSTSPWARLGGPGTGGPDGAVLALLESNGELIVGGSFLNAQGQSAKHVAKWNGAGWVPMGEITDGAVSSLASFGGSIYAGGSFTTTDAGAASRLAKWDGARWQAVGAGIAQSPTPSQATIAAMASFDGNLITGGHFTQADGKAILNIARWATP